jgi:ADP-heptose:LPS heptosyltransferase
MLKGLWRRYGPNPFDALLRKAQRAGHTRFLICWNRGLGDIALGLYALVHRIRAFIPQATVTFLTRPDLQAGFQLLDGVHALACPEWKRGVPFDLADTLSRLELHASSYDVLLERPDPTRWLMWQLGTLVPKMRWDPVWDALAHRFPLTGERPWVGVHVQTETSYAYEKNWPVSHWRALFARLAEERGRRIVLFGFRPEPSFEHPAILDLRGKTTLHEMLAIIKNRCSSLVLPDSGVLSLTYYLDAVFPIHVISLWADPHQGILRQRVSSPNPALRHHALRGRREDISTISVDQVLQCLP